MIVELMVVRQSDFKILERNLEKNVKQLSESITNVEQFEIQVVISNVNLIGEHYQVWPPERQVNRLASSHRILEVNLFAKRLKLLKKDAN